MKTIIFDDNINTTTIKKLIDEILFVDDEIELYFSSAGGYTHSAEMLIDFINKSNKRIVLKCFGQIQSAAFTILCAVNCNKIIMDTAWGMIHNTSNEKVKEEGKIINKFKKKIFNIFKKNTFSDKFNPILEEENIKYRELYIKSGISKDKILKMINNEMVYFRNDEMKNIFMR